MMDVAKLDGYGRKITGILFAAQSLFSAGNIMLFTISSIIAVRLSGNVIWTGVPMTLQLAGAALAALPLGRFMDRYGRRAGLNVGQSCGVAGTLTAGAGVIAGSLASYIPTFLNFI
jgi:MFS family permease